MPAPKSLYTKERINVIISASRRTDIPAFYSEWFYNRIKDGYVLVRNPINIHQVSRISLSPKVVDCIVFWTKNPKPMMKRLDELKDYNYYFQFTLNSYSTDIEPNVPSKGNNVIGTFISLSEKIGPERIIWRYDPIIITQKYTIEYHTTYFETLAQALSGKFSKCVISFVDEYKKNAKNFRENGFREPEKNQITDIAKRFSEIAERNKFKIYTCAEQIDLSEYGIEHNSCIDKELIENLVGAGINIQKDKAQRDECGCVESIDIGSYNTCTHSCKYCYANYSDSVVHTNSRCYDPNSPILCSSLQPDDKVTERSMRSLIENQLNLW